MQECKIVFQHCLSEFTLKLPDAENAICNSLTFLHDMELPKSESLKKVFGRTFSEKRGQYEGVGQLS